VLLEVGFIRVEHTIEPRKELLGAVVGVEDDGNAVDGSNAADVVGSGDGTSDGGLLAIVADALSGKVGSTTLRDLENDGAVLVASGLKARDDGGGRGDINGGNSKVLLLSVLEETEDVITDNDAGLAGKLLEDTHCDYGLDATKLSGLDRVDEIEEGEKIGWWGIDVVSMISVCLNRFF
jgi:hypothetical protein